MSDEKRCPRCSQTKATSEFHLSKRGTTGLQAECKACQADRYSAWYAKNRVAKLEATRRRIGANQARVLALKLTMPCVDCGWQPANEEEAKRLDFDHSDPETKYRGHRRTGAFSAGWSWARIERELALCVTRCRSCHMARTTREGHRQRRYQHDPEVNR